MKNKIVLFLLISAFLISLVFIPVVFTQDDDHHGHDALTESQCHNPTEHLVIPAVHQIDGKLSFGEDVQTVSKGACVMVHFINPYGILHDLTIDADESINFEGIHVALKNSTAGLNETNQQIVNIQMPDDDVTLKFYCSVEGHEEAGMIGQLIVGEGSPEASAPGFEFLPLILGLITSVIIGIIVRNKRKA